MLSTTKRNVPRVAMWSSTTRVNTSLALPVDLESVLVRAPQAILSTDDGDPVRYWSRFGQLEAVAGKTRVMDDAFISASGTDAAITLTVTEANQAPSLTGVPVAATTKSTVSRDSSA